MDQNRHGSNKQCRLSIRSVHEPSVIRHAHNKYFIQDLFLLLLLLKKVKAIGNFEQVCFVMRWEGVDITEEGSRAVQSPALHGNKAVGGDSEEEDVRNQSGPRANRCGEAS